MAGLTIDPALACLGAEALACAGVAAGEPVAGAEAVAALEEAAGATGEVLVALVAAVFLGVPVALGDSALGDSTLEAALGDPDAEARLEATGEALGESVLGLSAGAEKDLAFAETPGVTVTT
jgi:hypothetical protein